MKSVFKGINTIVPNKNFTIFTGDVIEGAVWLVNEEVNYFFPSYIYFILIHLFLVR